jgi:predicted amidophosphoribosyltransferase
MGVHQYRPARISDDSQVHRCHGCGAWMPNHRNHCPTCRRRIALDGLVDAMEAQAHRGVLQAATRPHSAKADPTHAQPPAPH